jgi:putative cell wall-binding protein
VTPPGHAPGDAFGDVARHPATGQVVAPAALPDAPGTKRLAGGDRYSTAAAVAQDSFPAGPVPVVYVATGEVAADALAAGPAADVQGGPVLLVGRDTVPAVTRTELTRLRPQRIVVLGGTAAITDAVTTELQSFTAGAVTRQAGADRYATAALVATTAFPAPVTRVFIATGTGSADAPRGGCGRRPHRQPGPARDAQRAACTDRSGPHPAAPA